VAHAHDPAEFLGIEMDEFAGAFAFIRRTGTRSSRFLNRPSPQRRKMAPTVERGKPSRPAMAGPESLCRRKLSIKAIWLCGKRWRRRRGTGLALWSAAVPPPR